ncbi:hypothetical protein FZEAL_7036 [Fusarium zealandicum]|uniref:Zn(2)-C6 fungal-type domain-containing protein n=1 Tax=Fusarium zealandicum TaxID=1053134 RepID=A0A8H4UHB6_9HYPO|nr:hypothetical protein FZEAL_7036 [Fusarium zealandicum]
MSKRPLSNAGNSQSDTNGYPSKRTASGAQIMHSSQPVPHISRNIKACTTCRRLKIKCLMGNIGPPCRRCQDKKLTCVVSKNLQSIIDEKTELSEAVLQDLAHLHTAVKELRSAVGLPDLSPLQTSAMNELEASTGANSATDNLRNGAEEDIGPSCDNSPRPASEDDQLSYVPIHSLYTLTKMRALRSPDNDERARNHSSADFISRGEISLADAERLFAVYRDRLDGFIYSIGCRYDSLEELRQKSPILTSATLTVAALHDPQANKAYGICSSELRRLIEKSMLHRQLDQDYFRALSISAYWLSDLSWTLSGHAIRRATECNFHTSFDRAIKDGSNDTADCARIWSVLYVCDQHLAMLYGRPAIIQEEWSTQDWDAFLQCPFATSQDERLMSQVELMGILRNVRQLFGLDKGETIPRIYLNQIGHFGRQLDQWVAKWTVRLPEQYPSIGAFPRKGAMLHFHFAQLYLHSHVFRGLAGSVPSYFSDAATMATSAASSIVDLLLTDPDVSSGIVGMPSYLLSMTAFTCMFLAKLAHKFDDSLVTRHQVLDHITRLVGLFRSIPMGKWHLANLMIGGLEKASSILTPGHEPGQNHTQSTTRPSIPNDLDILMGQSTATASASATEMMLPRVDGNSCFTQDALFGLSPLFDCDPSLLDGLGYLGSMEHSENNGFF